MSISIIIPVLDEASTLRSMIERVLSIEGSYEIIVVDGGSTDGTRAIAAGFAGRYGPRLTLLDSAKGRARQMNAGAAWARGEVLLFLHADTALPADALGAVEGAMADTSVVGGRFRVRLDRRGWRYRMVENSINLRDRFFRGFTGDQAVFIRTRTYRQLGGFADLPLMEDLDMAKRLCRCGRVVRLQDYVITSARRWQRHGVFRTVLLMWALRFLFVVGCPPSRLARLYGNTR